MLWVLQQLVGNSMLVSLAYAVLMELQIRELRNEVAALEGKRELNAETMFAKLFPMLEGYVPAFPMHNMHRLSPWSALAHWYRLEAAEAEIHRLDLVLHAATAPVRVATFTLRYQSSAALHAHHAFVWTGVLHSACAATATSGTPRTRFKYPCLPTRSLCSPPPAVRLLVCIAAGVGVDKSLLGSQPRLPRRNSAILPGG